MVILAKFPLDNGHYISVGQGVDGAVFDEFAGEDVDGAAVFDGILAGKDFGPAPGDNHICGGGDAVTLTGNGGDAAVDFNIALAGFEGGGFEAVIPAGDVEGAVVELHGFGAANAVIHGVDGDGAAVYINVILAVDAVIDVAIDGERAGAFDVHVVLGKDGPAGTGIIKGVGHVRRAGDDGVFGALRHAEAQLFRLLHIDGGPAQAGDAGRVQNEADFFNGGTGVDEDGAVIQGAGNIVFTRLGEGDLRAGDGDAGTGEVNRVTVQGDDAAPVIGQGECRESRQEGGKQKNGKKFFHFFEHSFDS